MIKRIYVLLGLLVISVLLSGLAIYIQYPQILTKDFLQKIVSNKEQSSAEIWVEGSDLKLKFDIKENEKALANNFLQQLGVGYELMEGISVELDPKSIDFLKPSTPAQVSLSFKEGSLSFKSKTAGFNLQSSLPKNDFNFATGSSSLNLKVLNGQSYNVLIKDPKPLLDYASVSGQIVYSRKIEPSLPVLSKIDTIKLSVSGKSINGEVKLK